MLNFIRSTKAFRRVIVRNPSLLLLTCSVFALGLTGCGSSNDPAANAPAKEEPKKSEHPEHPKGSEHPEHPKPAEPKK
jgi:hypothetical protein